MTDLLLVWLLGAVAAIVAYLLQRTWMERRDHSRRHYRSDSVLVARGSAAIKALREGAQDLGPAASRLVESTWHAIQALTTASRRETAAPADLPAPALHEAAAPARRIQPDPDDGPVWPDHPYGDARAWWERLDRDGCPGCPSSRRRGEPSCARCGRPLVGEPAQS